MGTSFSGTDRYEIRDRIGAGGMGVVYEAFDRERGAVVALKTLSQASPTSIARFKREFRSLADVMHPNLVTLYELVANRGDIFFTMELVPGVHFDRWVRVDSGPEEASQEEASAATRHDLPGEMSERADDTRSLPANKAQEVAAAVDMTRLRAATRQLAEGVHAIHCAGLLHRDLKPSNVKVTEQGRLVVLDFGLVTDLAEEQQSADDRPLVGTVTYMSPEQGARQPLAPPSDWYSVGVILYVCLTGRAPFLGGRDDVLMDKQRFEPPAPHELAPQVPGDLSALCVELLRRDPERRPEGPDVLRRLGSTEAARAVAVGSLGSSMTQDSLLVGRDAELAALHDAFGATQEFGRPVVAHVRAPSGAGKSRVVKAFADELMAKDMAIVLRGRCYETESVPFKAVDSLVDALSTYLARMPALEVEGLMPRDALALARVFPVLRQVEAVTAARRRVLHTPNPQELRQRAFQALGELLARLADRRPLVLAIDDLQWGDVDSASLLSSLLLAKDPPSLLLVSSYRSEDQESSAFLTAFERQTRHGSLDVRVVELSPLSTEHCRELALLHLGAASEASDHATRIAQEAQGSPLFVEELARHVRDRDASDEPVSLDEVLRGRLLRLPDAALQLLTLVAIAGRPIPQSLALRAAGVTDPTTLSILKAGSFVRGRASGDKRTLEPYHDRVRETAIAIVEPEVRRDVHARLAAVFEATPQPDPELLAYHYEWAGVPTRAATYAAQAAVRAAATLAFDRAAGLYRMALDLADGTPDAATYIALGEALANAGRGAEAAEAYLSASALVIPSEALELRSRAAAQLMVSGHVDRALAELETVAGAIGTRVARTPTRALMSVGLNRVKLAMRGLRYKEKNEREVPASELMRVDVMFSITAGLGMADVIRGADFQGRHLLMALKAGEPSRVSRALAGEAIMLSFVGTKAHHRTERVLDMMREIAARVEDPATHGIAAGTMGLCAFNEGRWQDALEGCGEAERIFRDECVGCRWEFATAQLFVGSALAIMGRVRDMLDRYPRMLKEATERGDLYAATMLRACLGFYVPLTTGDPSGAIAEVDEALRQWTPHGFHLQHLNALHSQVRVDLYEGLPERGLERCEAQWPAMKRSLLLRGQLMRTLMVAVRAKAATAAYAAGRKDESLLRMAARSVRAIERERVPYADAHAWLLRAELAHCRGNLEDTLQWLEKAEHASFDCDLTLNAQCARYARGRLLGGDEGAALVADARAYFDAEGMARPDRIAAVFAPDLG